MDLLHIGLALCVGIALSAACGFRVFVPLLVLSIAVRFCSFPVNDVLRWVGSDVAFITLIVATVVEILAYYIPFVDNALDMVCGPLALVAGTLITAGVMPEMSDFLRWSLGIIAGAGAAGVVQVGTSTTRATSSATTAGLGNSIVSTAEAGCSIVGSVLAVALPAVAVVIAGLLCIWVLRLVSRLLRRCKRASA